MRILAGILFVFSILFGTIQDAITLINYNLNNSNFTKSHCVNKANKSCKGKCAILDIFKEKEPSNSSKPVVDFENKLQQFVYSDQTEISRNEDYHNGSSHYYLQLSDREPNIDIFHPPK